jgi:hypothetical protein
MGAVVGVVLVLALVVACDHSEFGAVVLGSTQGEEPQSPGHWIG